MACSYQNCQLLLRPIISHLPLLCERNSGVSGCVTSWHSDSIQLTKTAGEQQTKTKPEKNSSFCFRVGSGCEVESVCPAPPGVGKEEGRRQLLIQLQHNVKQEPVRGTATIGGERLIWTTKRISREHDKKLHKLITHDLNCRLISYLFIAFTFITDSYVCSFHSPGVCGGKKVSTGSQTDKIIFIFCENAYGFAVLAARVLLYVSFPPPPQLILMHFVLISPVQSHVGLHSLLFSQTISLLLGLRPSVITSVVVSWLKFYNHYDRLFFPPIVAVLTVICSHTIQFALLDKHFCDKQRDFLPLVVLVS